MGRRHIGEGLLRVIRRFTTDCPICQGVHSNCCLTAKADETGAERWAVLCASHKEVPDWHRVPGHDLWSVYLPNNPEEHAGLLEGDSPRRVTPSQNRKQKEPSRLAISTEWRTYLHNHYAQQFGLGATYRADLLKRGLSETQIIQHGFWSSPSQYESLPSEILGATEKYFGDLYKAADGYWIPIYNPKGEVWGHQRRRFGLEKDKYRWPFPTDREYSCYSAEFGELPIQVLPSKTNNGSDTLFVCEGILKPLVAHLKSNQEYSWLGASGGRFSSSPLSTVSVLLQLMETRPIRKIVFAADPGSFNQYNKDGERIHNVAMMLLQQQQFFEVLGLEFFILDWGQLLTKSSLAIDDLPTPKLLEVLEGVPVYSDMELGKQLFLLKNGFQSFNEISYPRLGETPQPYEHGSEITKGKNYLLSDSQIVPFYDWFLDSPNLKYLLDTRPVGSGKSHYLPQIDHPCYDNIYYVCLSPRMPPTEDIEKLFAPMPSRHGGLVKSNITTPLGKPVFKRPTPKDKGETLHGANCLRADDHQTAMARGIASRVICNTCPVRQDCLTGGAMTGYDYLYQKMMAVQNRKFITALGGLKIADINEETILIFDEPPSSAPFSETITIPKSHVRFYLQHLWELFPDLEIVVDGEMVTLKGEVNQEQLLIAADEIDIIINEKAATDYSITKSTAAFEGISAQCYDFCEALLDNRIVVRDVQSKYEFLRPNKRLQEAIQRAGKVIFLDATSIPKIFCAEYQLPAEEVVTITSRDKATDNLNVEVWADDAFNKRETSPYKQQVAAQVRDHLTKKYGDKVGFVTHSDAAVGQDIIYFSDSRGSNRFKEKDVLCLLGLPQPNLGAIQLEYQLLSDSSITFSDYYKYRTSAELLQALGRVRAYRRTEDLLAIVVANVTLPILKNLGYSVSYHLLCDQLGIPPQPQLQECLMELYEPQTTIKEVIQKYPVATVLKSRYLLNTLFQHHRAGRTRWTLEKDKDIPIEAMVQMIHRGITFIYGVSPQVSRTYRIMALRELGYKITDDISLSRKDLLSSEELQELRTRVLQRVQGTISRYPDLSEYLYTRGIKRISPPEV